MKKLIALLVLFSGLSLSTSAHVTKADIENMLSDVGTSIDQLEEFYVYNVYTYYTDGSTKLSYDKYTKTKGNHASLTETGIKLTYIPDEGLTSVLHIAYSSILTITVGKTFLSISLKQ